MGLSSRYKSRWVVDSKEESKLKYWNGYDQSIFDLYVFDGIWKKVVRNPLGMWLCGENIAILCEVGMHSEIVLCEVAGNI